MKNCRPHRLFQPWTSFFCFVNCFHHQCQESWWGRDRASLRWAWLLDRHMSCFKKGQRKYYLDLYFSFHYYCWHTTKLAVVSAGCVCLYSYTSLAVICCLAGSSCRMRGLSRGYCRPASARLRWIQPQRGLLKFAAVARRGSGRSSGPVEFYFLVFLTRKLRLPLRYLSLSPSQVLQVNFQIRSHSKLWWMREPVLLTFILNYTWRPHYSTFKLSINTHSTPWPS